MLALPLRGSTPELYHGKYIAGMFASGEQGVWYEPSLSNGTLFQDAAGTTPVTAVEQPVGLMKDKSGRGNHAKQTTSADRPVFSARYNLLTKTEQFVGGLWYYGRVSVATSNVISPNGVDYAVVMTNTVAVGSGQPTYVVANISGMKPSNSYTLSCYMKKGISSYGYLRVDATAGTATNASCHFNLDTGVFTGYSEIANVTPIGNSITSVGNGWYKCTATFALGAGATTLRYWAGVTNTSNLVGWTGAIGTASIYIWGASLVPSNQSQLPYQRVNTATDYDADPVKFPPYLKFNGTNSWMVTNSIDFTGTDKMTVFAGVRKLSDAFGVLAELSANRAFNEGAWSLFAPGGTSSPYKGYSFYNRGTATAQIDIADGYVTPISNVLTGIMDISNDITQLRINSITSSSNPGDLGAGKYGNYQIYIGRRGGITFPANIALYSLIIRGAATDDAHLTHTEKFIAYKTGVNL